MMDDDQELEEVAPAERSHRPSLFPFALVACIVGAVYFFFLVPKPEAEARPAPSASTGTTAAPPAAPATPHSVQPAATRPANPVATPPASPAAPRQATPSAASAGPRVLTDAVFREIGGSGVMVMDFWAEWCGPCRQQTPIIKDLAGTFASEKRVVVAKVDVDREEALADRFGIRSIPTVVILKDGKEVKRFVGVTDERTLARAVRSAM